MNISVSPQTEARLVDYARQEGIDPAALVEKLLTEYRSERSTPPVYTSENDPLMARLEAQIASAPTDLKKIREAEEDLAEFKRNMNSARKEVGGRLPYPEAE